MTETKPGNGDLHSGIFQKTSQLLVAKRRRIGHRMWQIRPTALRRLIRVGNLEAEALGQWLGN